MRIATLAILGVFLFAPAAFAGPGENNKPACNWGQLTKHAIHDIEDWDQGAHASDPSGDGHGPGDADQPRAGLPNLGVYPDQQGDLQATCEFVEANLPS